MFTYIIEFFQLMAYVTIYAHNFIGVQIDPHLGNFMISMQAHHHAVPCAINMSAMIIHNLSINIDL